MQTTTEPKSKAHPYELAGMGQGPYSFGGIIEMPNLSEDSAANFGNADPYAEIHAAGLKDGAGTCACCGMGIRVICIVIDWAGDKYGVGSDCIEKINDPALCDAAKVAVAKRRNRMAADRRDAEREAKRIAFQAQPATDSRALPGETNGQLQARMNAAFYARVDAAEKAQAERKIQFAAVIRSLMDAGSGFCIDMADALSRGALTERQAECVAKCHLGRRSKANAAAFDALIATLTA